MLSIIAAFVGSASCPGLPLTRGTTWTYRAEVAWAAAGGDSTRRRTLSWTTSVVSVRTSGERVAAVVNGWPNDLAWWTPGRKPSTSVLYCEGGGIYRVRSAPGEASAIVAALLSGERKPASDDLILRFPLHTGEVFGGDGATREDNSYAWFVESAAPVAASLRQLAPRAAVDSVYSVVYRTTPDYTLVGFAPGLGVVRYVYSHHGTTAEADARLVRYRR